VRSPSLIYGRRALTSGLGFSPSCTISTSNMIRRAVREGSTIDIEQMSSSLVATTDPTASCQLRELERALACLPGEQREVILLVGLEGMSYETAAQVLSVPVGTVRSRLSRGRDALRRLMDIPERGAGATAQASGALAA
jgi:RNA polymerase sigma factor (sigma-70 family)